MRSYALVFHLSPCGYFLISPRSYLMFSGMRNVCPITLTLPPGLISRVDGIADADGRSRSALVARVLQTFCDQIEKPAGDSLQPPPAHAGAPACGTGVSPLSSGNARGENSGGQPSAAMPRALFPSPSPSVPLTAEPPAPPGRASSCRDAVLRRAGAAGSVLSAGSAAVFQSKRKQSGRTIQTWQTP